MGKGGVLDTTIASYEIGSKPAPNLPKLRLDVEGIA